MGRFAELEELVFGNKDKKINSNDIINILDLKGCRHTGGYFHYTTIKAFLGMLKSQKLHLSAGTEMNDLLETEKCSPERWKKMYIASFSFGKYENMAMWGIYGDPLNEALRIKFSCANLNNVIKNTMHTKKVFRAIFDEKKGQYDYEPINPNFNFNIKIVDVIYYRGKSLEYNKKTIYQKKYPEVQECYLNSVFTGYLKNQAWFYENEARIIIEFEQSLPETSTVAIDFTSALQNISITSSPCISGNRLKAILDQKIEPLPNGSSDFNIEESLYKGFLHFRKRCATCTYNPGERKQYCAYLKRWNLDN